MAKLEKIQSRLDANSVELRRFVDVLYHAGNEVRFRMLYMIYKKERVVKEIAEVMNMSMPATAQHLQKLRKVNLVEGYTEKKIIHYSLHPENAKILRSLFREFDRQIGEEGDE